MEIHFISNPNDSQRLGDHLVACLTAPEWTDFRAAIAFIKRSGTKHINNALSDFVDRGGRVSITAGVDVGGTTKEAVEDLLNALKGNGDIYVFHNDNSSTFHPKIYLFKNEQKACVYIGSNNLTEGGLFINYEACTQLLLDLAQARDAALLACIEKTLDQWSYEQQGLCYRITTDILNRLILESQLPDESVARAARRTAEGATAATGQSATRNSLFRPRAVPPAPRVAVPEQSEQAEAEEADQAVLEDEQEAASLTVETPAPAAAQAGRYTAFIMTLQKTDVGVGQTTRGTQRRSPEIFIPLKCRDFDPDFWGWPNSFTPDPNWHGPIDQQGRGKMDRTQVMFRLGGDIFPVSIWYNPDKKDVRIRSEHIRRAGVVGDILYLERADGSAGYSYYAEIIPQGSARHAEYLALCTRDIRNSLKRWNYL